MQLTQFISDLYYYWDNLNYYGGQMIPLREYFVQNKLDPTPAVLRREYNRLGLGGKTVMYKGEQCTIVRHPGKYPVWQYPTTINGCFTLKETPIDQTFINGGILLEESDQKFERATLDELERNAWRLYYEEQRREEAVRREQQEREDKDIFATSCAIVLACIGIAAMIVKGGKPITAPKARGK